MFEKLHSVGLNTVIGIFEACCKKITMVSTGNHMSSHCLGAVFLKLFYSDLTRIQGFVSMNAYLPLYVITVIDC